MDYHHLELTRERGELRMTEISGLVGIKGKSGTLLPKIENTGRGYIQRGRGNRINEHKSRIIGFIVPVQY